MIRKMELRDIPEVAKIHKTALSDEFLPSLGEDFLRRLHEEFLKSGGFGFVEDQQRNVVGFITACQNFGKIFLSIFFNKWLEFSFLLFKKILTDPKIALYTFNVLLYPLLEKKKPSPAAELVVIAIESTWQGKGLGTKLIEAIENEMFHQGINEYKVTVTKRNAVANQFYLKLGFKLHFSFLLYGKEWNLYVKRLDQPV